MKTDEARVRAFLASLETLAPGGKASLINLPTIEAGKFKSSIFSTIVFVVSGSYLT